MEPGWKYLEYRVKVLGSMLAAIDLLMMVLVIVFAIKAGTGVIVAIMLFTINIVIMVAIVGQIIVPYLQNDKNMRLFLFGYTTEGVKKGTIELSPTIESMLKAFVEILESDQFLNANKRQAQYLALQNQINPHFLYNTLESIRSEAMEAGIDNVTNMTEALASFFRYTISNVENMVTLEDELENIETYFLIQKYRFEDRIELSIEIDEDDYEKAKKCMMPKLTLQPVVENSIIHGIERKMGQGLVKIIVNLTENRLIIRVSDDGIGMNQETLERLNRQLNQPLFDSISMVQHKTKGGIAVSNVNNRIRLIFGEEYGISLYSTVGIGTDMIISMPIITNKRQIEMENAVS